MNYPYASLGVVATLALAGCSTSNPLFGVSSDSTDGMSASSGGESSVAPTSEPVTSTTSAETGVSSVDPQTSGTSPSSTDPQTGGSTEVGVSSSSGASGGTDTDATACGNSIVEGGEECDDGNNAGGDGCSETCTNEVQMVVCGDGVAGEGEECDDGPQNSDGGGCTTGCKQAVCGDGLLHAGFEECDDGAKNSDDAACTSACKTGFCGDGLVLAGVEQCDDGEAVNGLFLAKCNAECSGVIPEEMLKIKVLTGKVAGSLNGNPGALGGDKLCTTKFGPGYKAMLADGADGVRVASVTANKGDGQKDWVLVAHRGYSNNEAIPSLVFITGPERLLGVRKGVSVPLANAIGGPGSVWTGLTKTWQSAEANCAKWTSNNMQLLTGAVGSPDQLGPAFIGGTTMGCASIFPIYCVQQPL